MDEQIAEAFATTADLQFSCVLIRMRDFNQLGRLLPHEELRDRGLLRASRSGARAPDQQIVASSAAHPAAHVCIGTDFHDKLLELARSPGKFVFFSHRTLTLPASPGSWHRAAP